MKIYLCESNNFMGYRLLGDLGQEYETITYPKSKNEEMNIYEKCLEMCIFHIYSKDFKYTKESPKVYMVSLNKDINQIDILNFKDIITHNYLLKKYTRDTSQSILIQDIKQYSDDDIKQLTELLKTFENKENCLILMNKKLLNDKQK